MKKSISERLAKRDAMVEVRKKILARRDKPTISAEEIEKMNNATSEILGKSFAMFAEFKDFAKVDKAKREVSGIASNEALDSYGDIVRFDAMQAAFPEYMKFANIREMHGPSAAGTVTDYKMDAKEKTTFITVKVVDDAAWNKVVEGVYKWFSIWWRIIKAEPLVIKAEDENGNEYEVWTGWMEITEIELIEISLVDRPANPDALISTYKTAKWFIPDLVFIEKDDAKKDLQKEKEKTIQRSVSSILSSNKQTMLEKVRALVKSFYKTNQQIDLDSIENDSEQITLSKSEIFGLIKSSVEQAVSEIEKEAASQNEDKSEKGEKTEKTDEEKAKEKEEKELAEKKEEEEKAAKAKEEEEKAAKAEAEKAAGSSVDMSLVVKLLQTVAEEVQKVNWKVETLEKNNNSVLEIIAKNAWVSIQKEQTATKTKSVFEGML
jgi:hypothetical protein